MVISELKRKLHSSIKKYGLDSKEVYELSIKLDEEINIYYKNTKLLFENYNKSITEIERYVEIYGKKPNKYDWNKFAKENGLLSSESIKYMKSIIRI